MLLPPVKENRDIIIMTKTVVMKLLDCKMTLQLTTRFDIMTPRRPKIAPEAPTLIVSVTSELNTKAPIPEKM